MTSSSPTRRQDAAGRVLDERCGDPAGLSLAVLYPDADGTVVVVDANEAVGCRYYVDRSTETTRPTPVLAQRQAEPDGRARAVSPHPEPWAGTLRDLGRRVPPAITNRAETFTIWNEVSVYGGFAGGDELADRDIAGNPTILSGDIGVPGDASDNSHHVVTSFADARLDGLQIRDGNSQGQLRGAASRGGFVPRDGHLSQVIVADNRTGDGLDAEIGSSAGGLGGCGAGVYAAAGTITIEDSQILNNVTGNGGAGSSRRAGGDGAGLCVNIGYEITILNTEIRGNVTGVGGEGSFGRRRNGGGVFIDSNWPGQVRGSVIAENVTGQGSGQAAPHREPATQGVPYSPSEPRQPPHCGHGHPW